MLERLRERTDEGGLTPDTTDRSDERTVALEPSLFQFGRALFGTVLAYMAMDNLRNLEERVAYAEAKGVPAPDRTVPFVSGSLLLGSAGLALWRLPRASAVAVAGFFLSVTPQMHDFWNAEDDEERQRELIQFLKNAALFGAALVFLQLGGRRQRE